MLLVGSNIHDYIGNISKLIQDLLFDMYIDVQCSSLHMLFIMWRFCVKYVFQLALNKNKVVAFLPFVALFLQQHWTISKSLFLLLKASQPSLWHFQSFGQQCLNLSRFFRCQIFVVVVVEHQLFNMKQKARYRTLSKRDQFNVA